MTIPSRSFSLATLWIGAALGISAAQAQDSSSWVDGLHSRTRLIAGRQESGRLLAGIEIRLDPGFKTYWRNPGDSGLPPRFDWTSSANTVDLDLRWPVPTRIEDAGGIEAVYEDKVVLPILVLPRDPGQPVDLRLSLDYGICKDICIPVHADLKLLLDPQKQADPQAGQVLEEALAAVPIRQALGASGEISILKATRQPGDKPVFRIEVRTPPKTQPVLFAEGPDGWYLSTSSPEGDAFLVTVEEKPEGGPNDIPVHLTLGAGSKAVETEVRLDAAALPR